MTKSTHVLPFYCRNPMSLSVRNSALCFQNIIKYINQGRKKGQILVTSFYDRCITVVTVGSYPSHMHTIYSMTFSIPYKS